MEETTMLELEGWEGAGTRDMVKIWSVKQAAKELGISERRVRKLLAESRIKGKKLDGTWVVLKLYYAKKRG